MIIVGLTGGIGSGKTTVASMFAALGIPVYTSDDEAKRLMRTSSNLKRKLIDLFGEDAYVDGELNKPYIAQVIFNDTLYLNKMNALVHPAVAKDFKDWVRKQQAPYVIKEAAILFENEGYKQCDVMITVTAPKSLRIERLLNRDHTTVEKIEAIMKNQWTDAQKAERSHFVIENINRQSTQKQVYKIHQQILKMAP